jgi:hypothetical protein
MEDQQNQQGILDAEPKVVNIGAKDFAEMLAAQSVAVIHLNWKAPPENPEIAELLDALL